MHSCYRCCEGFVHCQSSFTNYCDFSYFVSRVIWLGDLNYRISLSYEDTKKLLTENNWDALFEKDQVNFSKDALFFETSSQKERTKVINDKTKLSRTSTVYVCSMF